MEAIQEINMKDGSFPKSRLQEWFNCIDLPREKCNKYRVRHGFDPLPENVAAPKPDHKEKVTTSVKKVTANVAPKAVGGSGPGTELSKLFAMIGIKPTASCGCNNMINQMNVWGVEGCEKHFDQIVSHLNEAQHQYRWTDKLRAATATVWSGLAFKIDPLNPFPSLVRIAIENAKASRITQQS